MTRKIFALLLAVVMLLSFAACDITWPDLPFVGSDPTDPPATEPPATEPPATEPPATEPPATEPPATEPPATEPAVYLNLTGSHLGAIGKVTADTFDAQMNANWNFGWEGDGSLTHNAGKADFDFTAAESDVIWRLGGYGAENTVQTGNAGWGVQLWSKGEGNIAYMYNKIDIPEYATQFRVWGVTNTDNHWSGSGAIRAVALYKDADGNYVKHVFTPKADTFLEGSTASFNEEKGTVEFASGVWSIPGVLDGCMVVYDMADLAGKEDVVIVIESIGLGTIFSDEYTEAAEGVPAGEVMPECFIAKRVMFVVEPPVEVNPDAPTESVVAGVPNGMTAEQIDALPVIGADEFATHMNENWNIGWHDTSIEGTAGKVDFANNAAADAKIWRTGVIGTGSFVNGGWCVVTNVSGVGSSAYMYNKIDVPAEGVSQFRVWVGAIGDAAIRVTAVYKNESGEYESRVMVPIGEAAALYNAEDGTVRFSSVEGVDWSSNGITDGMIIYDPSSLLGKTGVTFVVESIGLADGVTNQMIVKRIIIC